MDLKSNFLMGNHHLFQKFLNVVEETAVSIYITQQQFCHLNFASHEYLFQNIESIFPSIMSKTPNILRLVILMFRFCFYVLLYPYDIGFYLSFGGILLTIFQNFFCYERLMRLLFLLHSFFYKITFINIYRPRFINI